jgi:hypothetical protein
MKRLVAFAFLLLVCPFASLVVYGQQTQRPSSVATESGGVIQGVVSTQSGTIPLGGVLMSLSSDRTAQVRTVMSEGDGSYRFQELEAGRYRVSASLEGFETITAQIDVVYNQTATLNVDLRLALTDQVEVVAPANVVSDTGTLSSRDNVSSEELEQISPGGGLSAALRLLISVIEVPGGVAIKGGRPSAATTQLGPGMFVDPATGLSQVRLPDDAIDSVTVLPNPYAVEYGRFSSGLVLIQTRRGGDQWRTRLNNLDPAFRTKRGEPLNIIGVSSFGPRFEIGGPLARDRLFLQQSAQYRYRTNEIPSRPQSDVKTLHAFSSFTRLDANLSPSQFLTVAGGLFPSRTTFATIGTFVPPEASADLHGTVHTGAVTQRSVWSDSLFSETTVEINRYRTAVLPQGTAAMQLLPETTLGNFFNRQNRTTSTVQVVETLSGSSLRATGLHLYKVGADVLYSRFSGSSVSAPVIVRRSDGTLSRRLDYGPPTTQRVDSVDVALFAQDRVQPTSRWYVEFGGRVDRDGIVDRVNITPRVGSAVLLNEAGTAVLRTGFGLFYERTPSAAGVFTRYESPIETRYAADGVTALAPPARLAFTVAPELRTARSITWDAAFDHRINEHWAIKAGYIDRRGSNELLIDRLDAEDGASTLLLNSNGQSRYREAEVGVHFTAGAAADLNVAYVRSMARADLNAFTNYFDSILSPIVRPNEYAPARADAPHRMLARGRVMPTPTWLVVGVLDWRTGLPYSVVNEALDFVGPRNSHRFPNYLRVELGVEHRFRIFKYRPWIGVRADNAFNAFLPQDVQANIGSPHFGTFYNSEYRQFRIQVRFER